jgi:hypothetical protein
LQLGPKHSPILVHLWTAARPDPRYSGQQSVSGRKPLTRTEMNEMPSLRLSPMCADVFLPTGKSNSWRLANTMIWSDLVAPRACHARWLQPKRKRGPMLLIESDGFRATRWIVITFPDGVEGEAHMQTFTGSGSAGADGWHRFDQTDKRGFLLIDYIFRGGGLVSRTPYRWNGRGFVPGETSITVFRHPTVKR